MTSFETPATYMHLIRVWSCYVTQKLLVTQNQLINLSDDILDAWTKDKFLFIKCILTVQMIAF